MRINGITDDVACRAENLQLQSSLADVQDEAQLLRRLLTLCNQALEDAERQAEPAPKEQHQAVADPSFSHTHAAERDEVTVHYSAASGYYRWPWFDQLCSSARSPNVTWQV